MFNTIMAITGIVMFGFVVGLLIFNQKSSKNK